MNKQFSALKPVFQQPDKEVNRTDVNVVLTESRIERLVTDLQMKSPITKRMGVIAGVSWVSDQSAGVLSKRGQAFMEFDV